MTESWETSMSRRLQRPSAPAAPRPAEMPRTVMSPAEPAPVAGPGLLAARFERGSRRSGAGRPWLRRLRGGWRADEVPGALARCGTVVQRPVPTGRRVVWVGMAGGVGTTTTAYAVASIMARLRGDGIAVLGAPEDRAGLAWRAAEEEVRVLPELWAGGASWEGGAEVACLAVPHPGGRVDAGEAALRLSRQRSYVMVDSGVMCDPHVVADAHAVVLVAPPTPVAADVLADLSSELAQAGVLGRTRIVVVDTGRDTGCPADEVAAALASLTPTHVVPPDRHLATGCRIDPRLLGEPALVGLSRLAAGIVDTALASADREGRA